MSSDNRLESVEAIQDRPLTVESESPGVTDTLDVSASETVQTETVQTESEQSDVSEGATASPPRRVRLNPTFDPAQLKAVPSLSPPPETAGDQPQERKTADLATSDGDAVQVIERRAPAVEPPPRAGKAVEIPPVVKDLDAEMEAEIEAAMSSGELSPIGTDAAQVAESAAQEDEERPAEDALESGHHITARIQSIHGDSVFLDLGYRSPGMVPLRQFTSGKKPEVGQLIEVLVDRLAPDEGLIYLNLPRGLRRIAGNWESLAKGQTVDCLVNRTNKGGLEVTVSGLRGFLPSSQIELGFVSDLEPYVGQKLRAQVMEVNPRKRNLVVSRRAYLQIERQEAEQQLWKTLEVGQTFTGRVKTIKDYGAFVDLGGVDGFLHIGEMAWHRIKHPSEVVQDGQTVDVKVLSLDNEKKKISLGMKQLVQNPWTKAADKYSANSTVSGTVTRIADFGVFVELEPSIEGLIHISELDHKHVRRAADVVKVHQVVTAQVLEVDVERKRISLSLKALVAKPEEIKPVEEPVEPVQRKRKGPLKGGTGSSEPRGLFGNPSDYRE